MECRNNFPELLVDFSIIRLHLLASELSGIRRTKVSIRFSTLEYDKNWYNYYSVTKVRSWNKTRGGMYKVLPGIQ
jgi:hypothetical protein